MLILASASKAGSCAAFVFYVLGLQVLLALHSQLSACAAAKDTGGQNPRLTTPSPLQGCT